MSPFLHRMSILIVILFALILLIGCGGNSALSSPNSYSSKSSTKQAAGKPVDPNVTPTGEMPKQKKQEEDSTRKGTNSTSKYVYTPETEYTHEEDSSVQKGSTEIFHIHTDLNDSASAVDDDIWRQFDLSEEYHAMGVVANREASWEEAQYYFEKSLKILANLDVEADSSMTPEAVKYSKMLNSVIADYRVTLRSLGNLEANVSSSVLLERFVDLADNLNRDTMVVYSSENQPVTYDIPIVMNDRVKSSIIYFQTVAKEAFYKYLRRSQKYTPMMKEIIREYGLPEDLVYLSLVESGYNPHAYSWARAMGLWQFISSTGRLYKLKRNWWIDERKDPVKSTHAACRFLGDLYKQFGSWELAMAAYNGGPGRVSRTIKKQKTRDFWKLRLKRQTMDYVPLIMAATIIGKNPAKYGFTDIEFEPEVVWEEVTIKKCLELSVVARRNWMHCPGIKRTQSGTFKKIHAAQRQEV